MEQPDTAPKKPRNITLGEAKTVGGVAHSPEDTLTMLDALGDRWSVSNISLVEWTLRALIRHGHDPRGQAVSRLLELARLDLRNTNDLRRLACGGAQDNDNFEHVFGAVCKALKHNNEEDRKQLTHHLLGWAYTNTLGTGPQHAAPLDQPHHPFLDYLKMAPSDHHTLATLGAAWARFSVEEDEYGMADPAAATWMLDRLFEKGVNLGEVLRCVVANGGDDERQRFLIDTLLDRGAGDGLALGDLPQYPGKEWVLELLDSHPKSRRNLLAEIGGGGGREPGRGPKL